MRRFFAILLLLIASQAQASYFTDTPVRSIDEMIEGCFSDSACAAQAGTLIPAYSKSSNIPEEELRDILHNCLRGQQTMNICAGYEQFVLKHEMSAALIEVTKHSSSSCKVSVEKQQMKWESKTWARCEKEADEEFGQGSAWSGVVMSCNSEALKKRIKALHHIGQCSPCSKCIRLP